MRHLRIAGLCLLAAFALSAVASASASAALPAFYQCAKAEKVGKKYTGKYNDDKCSEENAKGEGKFELEEWNAEGKGGESKVKEFKGKGGASFIEVPELGPMKCTGVTMTGEYTGPKTLGDISATLTGCGCHNTSTGGEIHTNLLKGEIGYFDETFGKPHARGVGLDLAPESSSYLAEGIECGSTHERWSGSLIAEVEPPYNEFTKEVKLKLEQSSGRQAIQSFEGMPKDIPLWECWCEGEWYPGVDLGFSGEIVNKGEEVELKA